MKLQYWSYDLQIPPPVSRSQKVTKTHQPTLIVELEHLGVKGCGEAPAIAILQYPCTKR